MISFLTATLLIDEYSITLATTLWSQLPLNYNHNAGRKPSIYHLTFPRVLFKCTVTEVSGSRAIHSPLLSVYKKNVLNLLGYIRSGVYYSQNYYFIIKNSFIYLSELFYRFDAYYVQLLNWNGKGVYYGDAKNIISCFRDVRVKKMFLFRLRDYFLKYSMNLFYTKW